MKKTILVLFIALIFGVRGQSPFQKKSAAITIGYGVPNMYRNMLKEDMKKKGNEYSISGFGPLLFKLEFGVAKWLGLGLCGSWSNTQVNEKYVYNRSVYNPNTQTDELTQFHQSDNRNYKQLSLGFRANCHFGNKKGLDPYIGVGVGCTRSWREDWSKGDENISRNNPAISSPVFPVFFSGTLGLRDYITEEFGVYLEVGWDNRALIQGGMAVNFPSKKKKGPGSDRQKN